ILVIHGDIDERVPASHSRRFVEELKKHNKPHKYLELKGANHFFGTIYYEHWMEMFPTLIDWLDNTCGLKN
ncbi:MAG: prolyl oligopeptidase family serine peptidase, partial [Porticoccaceae bacterium]|nr:prolyl oligopeptidase family serine peptidase [Porticoccaceae bacterium]